jgi:hypothetical protein
VSPSSPLSHTFNSPIFTSTREARIIFKAGKNRDGYFTADDLLRQVDKAIDIFQGLTNCYSQGLFLFDNAPSHQKRALDAISARNMVKGALTFPLSSRHHRRPIRWVFMSAESSGKCSKNSSGLWIPSQQRQDTSVLSLYRAGVVTPRIRGKPFRTPLRDCRRPTWPWLCLRCMRRCQGWCAVVRQQAGAD